MCPGDPLGNDGQRPIVLALIFKPVLNWLGNVAPRGIEESYGIMVNYLYDPKTIDANHEAFANDGMVVRSPEVNALIVPAAPPVGIAADGA